MAKQTHIFDGLSSSDVQQILAHGILRDYEQGELLLKKGSRSSEMFLIVEGAVRVFIEFHGIEIDLAKLGKGDVLGEMAAITHSPRTANAVIDKKSQIFCFDNDALEQLNQALPSVATQLYFNLLRIMAGRLADTNRRLVHERVERLEASLL